MNANDDNSPPRADASDHNSDSNAGSAPDLACERDGFPSRMVVAIDGWAHSGKNTLGEQVAHVLAGVLVDSGRFYRALTKACIEAGVDLNDESAVAGFCEAAALAKRVEEVFESGDEMNLAVNGRWFARDELKSIGVEVCKVARVERVRDVVNRTLKQCESYGRLVVLGRDIGAVVFPFADYKYFLTAPEHVREQRHLVSTGQRGAVERDRMDEGRVVIDEDAIVIDTNDVPPVDVLRFVLCDLGFNVNEETGYMGQRGKEASD